MTLLQSISQMIDNISVTDRQEESIATSLSNLSTHLTNTESGLSVLKTKDIGSYDRDTILRPLDDIDLLAVLNRANWCDKYGNLPSPQYVLTKFKEYLDCITEYKGKVKQDRPCVTLRLSGKGSHKAKFQFDHFFSIQEISQLLLQNRNIATVYTVHYCIISSPLCIIVTHNLSLTSQIRYKR